MTSSQAAPLRICLLRLSALGDVVLTLPLVQALLDHLPGVRLTWLIERRWLPVAAHLADRVELYAVDGPRTLAEYRRIRSDFADREFDVLLAAQAKLRVNLLYPLIRAPRKIGFDSRRAREGQWLFVNERIPYADQHLADGLLAFGRQLAAGEPTTPWAPPLAADALAWCAALTGGERYILLNPISSKAERDWPLARQIELARRLAETGWQGRLIVSGGASEREREWSAAIAAAHPAGLSVAGQTDLAQLFALCAGSTVLVSPDSAPVHIANAYGVPVVGLYAVARSALSGPWRAGQYCVDRYAKAVRTLLKQDPHAVDWHRRVHHPDAMALISVEEVLAQIQYAMSAPRGRGQS
ncbi:glycosyltransferase family 9 protein [Chitinolyticbacter albus]|uniref:glycosyltransferase family 9 protein n=1 Tax=Chitinolyticbacter albus TaxID=2961951 RepID=UPI00210A31A5|nr:glycosyltransferase family 9 protein [Chitinolyticbacter albus]